ncbi:plant expansin [Amylostereum chailletii]|nr:plant expansin [Amylostereum chailletii]
MRFTTFCMCFSILSLFAAAAPTNNSISARQVTGTQTGTYFEVGLGACGIQNIDSDYIVAVSKLMFDTVPGATANPNNNPLCNRVINAHYEGNAVTVTVTDRCEACAFTDLDFSPAAFSQLANQAVGRLTGMTWEFV